MTNCIHRDGCSASAGSRGLCGRHYSAIYTAGGSGARGRAALDAAGYPATGPVRRTGRRPLSALEVALSAGDRDAVIAAVLAGSALDPASGCWLWQGTVHKRGGYPFVRVGEKSVRVHRLVLEAVHGGPLGSQQGHHKCAVRSCVNPAHLAAVTAAENIAEMLARGSYVARIRELEAALAALDPEHPLLGLVPVV